MERKGKVLGFKEADLELTVTLGHFLNYPELDPGKTMKSRAQGKEGRKNVEGEGSMGFF